MLAVIDIAVWRRRDARVHWGWTLWGAPGCLVLYGLGWGLDEVAPSEWAIGAWLGMILAGALGGLTSAWAALLNRGVVRLLVAINACALVALAVRCVVFVQGIRLM